jgi:glycosyltransferase involved in cell wall biosynthesis
MIKMINALDKNKYEATVFLIKDSVVRKKLEENNIPYIIAKSNFYKKYYYFFLHWEPYYVPFYNILKIIKLSVFWLLSRYFFAKKELQNIDFDIAHLNSSQITDWLAPCKKKGKVIMHIREPLTKGNFGIRYAFFKKQMQKYADRIIAISYDNATRVGLPEKTDVVYNFSEIPKFSIDKKSYQSKRVLYLGGAQEIKGFDTLVKALDYLDNDVTIYFAGNYSIDRSKSLKSIIKRIIGYGRKKEKLIEKMKKHPRAIELGMIYNVSDFFNKVCCLVAPFTKSHFARPVIEAYLHKKPAIGTDVEGMDEIIEDNKTGIICEKNNYKALASAINDLVNNPLKVQNKGEYSYSIAVKKFTSDNINKIMTIYNTLL